MRILFTNIYIQTNTRELVLPHPFAIDFNTYFVHTRNITVCFNLIDHYIFNHIYLSCFVLEKP